MRTLLRAGMLVIGILSISAATFSQQVAKTIPYAAAPEGHIGFLQFTPPDYGSQKHPLIIFLHGIGERGNGTSQINKITANAIPNYCAHGATMRFTVNGVTSSFVVLSPQLSTQLGYWPTYYAKQMIAYAKANLQIDPNRIYVCGLSLGGGGVWRLITDTQNFDHTFDGTIAAAAPVCGTQEETDGDFCSTIGANHLPIWAFHSMDDGTVGVGATQHAQILSNMCGITPAPLFTYYQNGNHAGAWIHAYDTGHITVPVVVNGVVTNFKAVPNMYEWFLSNTRGSAPTSVPANTPPVANAGVAQAVTLPINLVTLTGTGTGTNGASIVSYSWAKTSGPAGGTINLPLLNTTLVTGLVQGIYVFTLTVKDNHGLTSSSSVTITVNPLLAANQPPVANAGPNITIAKPNNSVQLDATRSSDPDGYVAKYTWSYKGKGPAAIEDVNAARTAMINLTPGTYTVTLTVTDNSGATSSTNLTVTVNPGGGAAAPPPANNQPPVANAGPDITVNQPNNSVQLDATRSYDPDGYVAKYAWSYKGPGPAAIEDVNASRTAMVNLTPGTYSITLTTTDNNGASNSTVLKITVNGKSATPPAPPTPPVANAPIGYIKQTVGLWQACGDASATGRIPVYSSGIANGNVVYLDAGLTKAYNGGYNWFSFTATLGGPVTEAFAVFPDGVIHLLNACAQTTTPTPPVVTPTGNLLGYIKLSSGPYQACDDASSSNRIPVYGISIANGSYLYSDAAMKKVYNGGWNWYSFTPVLGGSVTYAFAVYPIGTIGLLTSCGSSRVAAGADRSVSSANTAVNPAAEIDATATGKLSMYPNPVRNSATIQLSSLESGAKKINLYNSSGVLAATYTWQTTKGNNTFSLNNISGLPAGLYIADVRDSNGKPVGKIKFVKQ